MAKSKLGKTDNQSSCARNCAEFLSSTLKLNTYTHPVRRTLIVGSQCNAPIVTNGGNYRYLDMLRLQNQCTGDELVGGLESHSLRHKTAIMTISYR